MVPEKRPYLRRRKSAWAPIYHPLSIGLHRSESSTRRFTDDNVLLRRQVTLLGADYGRSLTPARQELSPELLTVIPWTRRDDHGSV